ncbi:MAG: nucleotide sugar dehydrogenase [Candidatus Hydrogenedentes bacterium]|nr:nucleotide sugar dehydrogenase [Candidatus Hydrogenedentota bacterium]
MPNSVAVIGMGYVGVPLAVELVRGGLTVIGIEVDADKVAQLRQARSYLLDVPDAVLRDCLDTGRFSASDTYEALAECDAACICVPTPLSKSQDPDISYIVRAAEQLRNYLHPGMLIVLESTTYPGTTDEVVLPILEESGLKAGKDFFLAFSPERVDPGNDRFGMRNTPKVVGGVTPACGQKAQALYRHAVENVVAVSNARTAEMVKLLENTFRAINIGLVNELAMICDKLGIDVWEVIEAAKTKPFGFMPFYPGPGLGGHCIPIDPLYLSWKLRQINYTAKFIELASAVNSSMPEYVVEKITALLNDVEKSVKGSRILILGVTYKKDVADTRESPAIDIMSLLAHKGAILSYADPYAATFEAPGVSLSASDAAMEAAASDLVVVVTDHSAFDYPGILAHATLVLDTRNVTARFPAPGTCRVEKL